MPTAFLNMLPQLGFTSAILLCAILTADAAAQMPCSYSVTIVPNQDCGLWTTPANPVAINNNGLAALASSSCGNPSLGRSFLWQSGQATLTPIPLAPGSLGFHVRDLNDAGVAVGMLDMPNNLGTRAGVYDSTNGQWTILDPPVAGGHSEALAISANGFVCGWRSVGPQLSPKQAFVWSAAEGFRDLFIQGSSPDVGVIAVGVNSSGQVLVRDQVLNGSIALIWEKKGITQISGLPGGLLPLAFCLSESGVCAGAAINASWTSSRAFVWRDGAFTLLPNVSGYEARSVGFINAHNVMSGLERHPVVGQRGFIQHGLVRRGLNTIVPAPVTHIAQGGDMNDNGDILVQASFANGGSNIVLKPVFGSRGDTNCDGVVNVTDLLNVIGSWGACLGCPADLDGTDQVNVKDLIEVVVNWGLTGGGP